MKSEYSMRVVAGTKNPAKLKGVESAFRKFFGNVELHAVEVDSDVPSQPFDDQTIVGAINRAKKSFSEEYDFSVGVEAGLFKIDYAITGYIDFQVACVFDGSKYTIGFGPGFEYPPIVVKEARKGREVGKIMEKLTGIKNLGKKMGAIGYLTRGNVKRENLTEIAVTMALLPWINPKLYEL